MKKVDITGQVFGKLTVIECSDSNKHGRLTWLCECGCGNRRIATGTHLRIGNATQCVECKRIGQGASNTNTIDRLLKCVNKTPTGCWEYSLARDRKGYGAASYKGRAWKAHRLSYALSIGDIPDGMLVLHKCDNPCCINPAHLFLGTHQDNTDDMRSKGRQNYTGRKTKPNQDKLTGRFI